MPRAPKLTVDRDQLSKLIRPWAERLVTDIAAALAPKIEELLEDARTDAITRLEAAFAPAAEVDQIEEPPAEVVQPPRKSARPRTIVVDEIPTPSVVVVHHGVKPAATAEPEPTAREPRKCRSCREVGHRVDRCPNGAPAISEASAPPCAIRRCHLGPVRANRGRCSRAPRGRRVMAMPTRKASPWQVS